MAKAIVVEPRTVPDRRAMLQEKFSDAVNPLFEVDAILGCIALAAANIADREDIPEDVCELLLKMRTAIDAAGKVALKAATDATQVNAWYQTKIDDYVAATVHA